MGGEDGADNRTAWGTNHDANKGGNSTGQSLFSRCQLPNRITGDSAFTRLSFTIPLAITRPRISGTGTFPRQATVRVLPEWMTCRFERTTACASYSLFFS